MKYNGNSIEVLEGLEAVRRKPGMYLGGQDERALHHCIWEIVDNSIDEAMAGHCDKIKITLHKDMSITVLDNGRGLPVDIHPKMKIPTMRVIFTTLHAGGKFKEGAYNFSIGTHGVGSSCVCAVSEFFEAETYHDGEIYYDRYEKGIPVVKLGKNGKLKSIGKTDIKSGTKVHFKPDSTIFETTEFKHDIIYNHLKQSCFLNNKITIEYTNEILGTTDVFHYEDGLVDFMKELNPDSNSEIITIKGDYEGMLAEICMQLTDEPGERVFSYVNNVTTPNEGTHVTGFRGGLTKCINSYSKEFSLKEPLNGGDLRNGLTAIVSFKMKDPVFEGQTKGKLNSTIAKAAVESIMTQFGTVYFDTHYDVLKTLVDNAIKRMNERKKIEKKTESVAKNMFEVSSKLADCNSCKTNPEKCEIFIVEGDSAAGTSKSGRFRSTQAILPLRGKVLNIEKASIDKVFDNKEIQTMLTAFTTNQSYGEDFDITKMRYGKVIIMADADVDGGHIVTLLLTFFYRYFKQLITDGYVYIALTPLYIVTYSEKGKKANLEKFLYSDKELEQFKKSGVKIHRITRAKGLGELDADQLKTAAFDEKTRKLVQVRIEDAVKADRVTSMLMGTAVEGRKKLIIERSKDFVFEN